MVASAMCLREQATHPRTYSDRRAILDSDPVRRFCHRFQRFLPICCLVLLSACHRNGGRVLEVAYVSGVQAFLRDRVAQVYEKTGIVKNGDRVEVLDHDRRFVKVRTATGVTGWVEQRYLVGQDVYDQIQKLTADNLNDPVQAQGATRNDTNLHVEPGRDTEHLYQISAGEKLLLLKRGTAEKSSGVTPPRATSFGEKEKDKNKQTKKEDAGRAKIEVPKNEVKNKDKNKDASKEVSKEDKGKTPAPEKAEEKGPEKAPEKIPDKTQDQKPAGVIEDWWLVRDTHNRVGWVLARMIDLDVPLDVAQYAEGQRIVAFFVLDQVQDGDKKVSQYLTVLTEPKDGLPFDFNQIRVFTWNVRRHRYETAYRERMEGVLPVTIAQENFDKEGVLPVFAIREKDDSGNIIVRKYKLNTPIVRRVLAPGEAPVHVASKKSATKKGKRRH